MDVHHVPYGAYLITNRGYSSVVEHSTADREVPGSNPGVPLSYLFLNDNPFLLLIIYVFMAFFYFI